MKLYYATGSSSLAIRILINELEIPCEYELVNLGTKETENKRDFLTISPKGYVPVLLLNDDTILTECGVILQYLADKYKAESLLPPVENFKRYRVLEWVNFIGTELHKGLTPLIAYLFVPLAPRHESFVVNIKNRLNYINKHMANNQYLTGDNFTIADAYLFVLATCLPLAKINIAEYPHVHAYFSRLTNRKSILESLKAEGLSGFLN